MNVLTVCINLIGLIFSILTIMVNPGLGFILLIINGALLVYNSVRLQKTINGRN